MNQTTFHFSFLLFAVFLLFGCSSSKVANNGSSLDQAEDLFKRGLYDEAITSYNKILSKIPNSWSAVKGLLDVYLEIKDVERAIELLEHQKELSSDSPFLYSRLGALYNKTGKRKEAIESYKHYISLIGSNHKNYSNAVKTISEIEKAVAIMNNYYEINSQPLSEMINSDQSEYFPSFTVDQQTLVFTRKIYGQEDLYTATRTDQGDYLVSPISTINTKFNEGAQAISGDGKTLVFTHCNEKFGYGGCDLYESKYEKGKWSKPKNIGPNVNTKDWESSPSLSSLGDLLYFSSNRSGGIGKSDIWVSKKDKEGNWGTPKNLGEPINTLDKEESPFIHADGTTLYFRSDGHAGLGGYDLFVSKQVKSSWMDPLNLGNPINSSENDGDLIVNLEGLKGYFSSDKAENGNLDIYEFDLPEKFRPEPMTFVRGEVLALDTKKPITGKITISAINNAEIIVEKEIDADGHFLIAVPIGKELAMHINNPQFVFHSSYVYYPETKHGQKPYLEKIYLNRIVKKDVSIEKPLILKNIFFETGSSNLKVESFIELNYLYLLMQENPQIEIKITGHTDDTGDAQINIQLSLDRATEVRKYLIERGISQDRIMAEGKGENQPISDNTTEEGRSKNRRTEFVIIKS